VIVASDQIQIHLRKQPLYRTDVAGCHFAGCCLLKPPGDRQEFRHQAMRLCGQFERDLAIARR